ncbi:Cupredoxin-like domain protein [anaerobic digester metagenome]
MRGPGNLYGSCPTGWAHDTSRCSHGGAGVTAEAARAAEKMAVAVMAEGFSFSTETITVRAGAEVTIEFDNRDDGTPHNVAVYTDASASEAIFIGEVVTGPAEITYTFTAPETPGNYFFRCDVHPSMHGAFVVT